MALILRDMRNMGVAALMVVTSYVSRWWTTSATASNPSCKRKRVGVVLRADVVCRFLSSF